MTTTLHPDNKKDLSGINNLKDLHREIARTKILGKQREEHIKELAKKIPAEATIAALNGVIHIGVKSGVPTNIFNIVKNGVGLAMNIRKQQKGLRAIVTKGKELIVFTALNRLLKMYQQKRDSRKQTSEYGS